MDKPGANRSSCAGVRVVSEQSRSRRSPATGTSRRQFRHDDGGHQELSQGQPRSIGTVTVTRRSRSRATLAFSGEIDLSNAAQLRQRITACLAGGATDITIDMSALDFIDCAGIAALAVAIEHLERGRLVVRNPPPSARTIVKVTGIVTTMTIEDELWTEGGERRD
jgi:anti-sigma B factor antagonist